MKSRYFWLVTAAVMVSATSYAQSQPRELHAQPPPADDAKSTEVVPPAAKFDGAIQFPRYAFVESPWGGSQKPALFAALSGMGTAASNGVSSTTTGGFRLGGTWNRFTVHGLIARDIEQKWSPTLAAHVRLLGSLEQGYALGVLAQYKTDGFSEAGGEAEFGLTGGFKRGGFVTEINTVIGTGVEEKEAGEVDGEGKLRLGYMPVPVVFLGAEGQIRKRFAGDRLLPGNKTFDYAVGPQVRASLFGLIGSLTVGTTTMGTGEAVPFGFLTIGGGYSL
jgi:hypothetical protein